MTAILATDQPHHDRAEQLKHLRRQMASVSGKVGTLGAVMSTRTPTWMTCFRIRRPGFPVPRFWPLCCPTRCHGEQLRCCSVPGRCR